MHKLIRILLISALFLGFTLAGPVWPLESASAQPAAQGVSIGDVPGIIITAEQIEGGTRRRVPPQVDHLSTSVKTAMINVIYVGEWDPAAKAAFEYAKGIWENYISSPVPIAVKAEWKQLPASVLGSAKAHDYWRDFSDAPYTGTWYAVPLVNKLAGSDLNDNDGKDTDKDGLDVDVEIEATFNSAFSIGLGWYFGTDGNPNSQQWDFVSVVLHELGHGLGFSGSMTVSGSQGTWGYGTGYPFVFDRFTINRTAEGTEQPLLDPVIFSNPSAALGAALTGNSLFFSGSQATAANGGSAPKLYAPNTWQQGSSYSHLDESTYLVSGGNALMTPSLGNGEVIHAPGIITMGIFEDIGWNTEVHATVIHHVYLPALANAFSSETAGIYGQVTENGVKAGGIPVDLRMYDGVTWSTVLTATTDASGIYTFPDLPELSEGQYYSVRYQNSQKTPGRLWTWMSGILSAYTAGSSINIGNFDIADVPLVSPESGSQLPLPVTFEWKPRPANPADHYELDLYGPNPGDPVWWTDPDLGYASRFTLTNMPEDTSSGIPFSFDTPYLWEIWLYDPDGGHGISLQTNWVTFTSGEDQGLAGVPNADAALIRELRPHRVLPESRQPSRGSVEAQ